jgi:hypothetical protein
VGYVAPCRRRREWQLRSSLPPSGYVGNDCTVVRFDSQPRAPAVSRVGSPRRLSEPNASSRRSRRAKAGSSSLHAPSASKFTVAGFLCETTRQSRGDLIPSPTPHRCEPTRLCHGAMLPKQWSLRTTRGGLVSLGRRVGLGLDPDAGAVGALRSENRFLLPIRAEKTRCSAKRMLDAYLERISPSTSPLSWRRHGAAP